MPDIIDTSEISRFENKLKYLPLDEQGATFKYYFPYWEQMPHLIEHTLDIVHTYESCDLRLKDAGHFLADTIAEHCPTLWNEWKGTLDAGDDEIYIIFRFWRTILVMAAMQ